VNQIGEPENQIEIEPWYLHPKRRNQRRDTGNHRKNTLPELTGPQPGKEAGIPKGIGNTGVAGLTGPVLKRGAETKTTTGMSYIPGLGEEDQKRDQGTDTRMTTLTLIAIGLGVLPDEVAPQIPHITLMKKTKITNRIY
jgi:hypothetical protein